MPEEVDDPAAAANRLEAALERIARASARPGDAAPGGDDRLPRQVAARLDQLIGRLRAELGGAA